MIKIIHGDAADALATIESGSIDLTVTSPPYDGLRSYTQESEWSHTQFEAIATQLARITARGGVIVWNVADQTIDGSETGSSFRQALFFKEACGLKLADTMIYQKANAGGARGSNKTYIQSFEYMFVFSKGPLKTHNLIKDRPNKRAGESVKGGGGRTLSGKLRETREIVTEEFGRRFNVWKIAPDQQDKGHPAAMPFAMARDHILSWSNPNEMVLDPFLGSGTTALAAALQGRKFIGVEIAESYIDICCKRLAGYEIERSRAHGFISTFRYGYDPSLHKDWSGWKISEAAARERLLTEQPLITLANS